jgi:hypothetical protein
MTCSLYSAIRYLTYCGVLCGEDRNLGVRSAINVWLWQCFSLHLKRGSVGMKIFENLLGMIGHEPLAKSRKPSAQKRPNGEGDFRAVEISPRVLCCEAARRVAGKRYLLGKAPRMPLMGCTMPTTCSCMFLKNKDRRDGDRRLLGAGTSRWFGGVESRKYLGRRLTER